jgi:hypothetical protein
VSPYERMANTDVGNATVTTVWLGEQRLGCPCWTTVSLGTGNVDFEECWQTREEALAGHERWVESIRSQGERWLARFKGGVADGLERAYTVGPIWTFVVVAASSTDDRPEWEIVGPGPTEHTANVVLYSYDTIERADGEGWIVQYIEDREPGGDPDRVRRIRRDLIALSEEREGDEALGRVLDAWDQFEYAAGTAEGGEREVIS